MAKDRQPTAKEQALIDNVALGMTPTQAAKAAGYKNPSREASAILDRPRIKSEVQRLQEENRQAKSLTREKIQDMLMESYNVAHLQADANGMIRAVNELNRMLGYHTPEQKQIQVSVLREEQLHKLESMSDEELLQLSSPDVLDGEFEEIDEDMDDEAGYGESDDGPEEPGV